MEKERERKNELLMFQFVQINCIEENKKKGKEKRERYANLIQ